MSSIHSDAPAQRLRSILAGATSMTLRTTDQRAELVGRHRLDGHGQVRIDLPADSRLAADITRQGEVTAIIELTDLVPTPVRDRVRGRGTLSGWLTPAALGEAGPVGDLRVVLDLANAEFSADGVSATIDPAAFAAAEPDPLAADEADLLCHLDRHHPRTIERLFRLIDPHHRYGVQRVVPVRLDRHGLVLRLERVRGHRDVRLGFATTLRHQDELGRSMAALLANSAGCPHRLR
ncbi:DUF2470 domain-containing protein [Micromonospora sp. NPDC051196]|uniref:DUF2470 domain-containing protein n=1 Tax=Micromonospora sp. NPDC051196 TaxID=3155281 RepID=UPI003447C277